MREDTKPIEDAESLLAKQAKNKVKVSTPVVTKTETATVQGPTLTDPAIYRRAWGIAYRKQTEFRRKEIDRTMESGKLSDNGRDTDFARQVAFIAESANL